ncbi:MAG TPA: hypothetical protein VIV54_20600 [Burkholderiales bacterium]
MDQLPCLLAGQVEQQELEHAHSTHESSDRSQAAGLIAQLAMHSR